MPLAAALALTFATLPDPIQAGGAYTFAGCGYTPGSAVYFRAYEAGEHYLEFAYGTPTAPDGCFETPPAPWIWVPGAYTVEVWQARPGRPRLHRRLTTVLEVQ